jgi:hypothetical protein
MSMIYPTNYMQLSGNLKKETCKKAESKEKTDFSIKNG